MIGVRGRQRRRSPLLRDRHPNVLVSAAVIANPALTTLSSYTHRHGAPTCRLPHRRARLPRDWRASGFDERAHRAARYHERLQ